MVMIDGNLRIIKVIIVFSLDNNYYSYLRVRMVQCDGPLRYGTVRMIGGLLLMNGRNNVNNCLQAISIKLTSTPKTTEESESLVRQ